MNDALGEFKMKSSATRVGLTSLLAVCMLGGTGWVVYSKWIGADSSLTGANQTDSEIAGLIDPDAVISEQDIIPPTGDDFDRLSMATDAQPVSGGEDEFTLSIGEDSVSDAGADTGDDEFVVGDAAEPTTSTASDADSFVIGDQAAVDQFVASDPADEFTIADDTAPVAPSFDGQEDTTDFQIGDDSVTPTVTEAETPEATTVDEDQFSVSDIPVDPGTNPLVEDQPPVNLADDVALDAPGQLSLTEEPDLSPLPLPEANVDTGSSFEVGSDVSALPELTAQPGSLQLEGQQTPTLTVEKVAPAEVQVNRSAVFTTRIKNTGKVSAHGIRVTDFVPKGARLEIR